MEANDVLPEVLEYGILNSHTLVMLKQIFGQVRAVYCWRFNWTTGIFAEHSNFYRKYRKQAKFGVDSVCPLFTLCFAFDSGMSLLKNYN